MDQTRAQHAAAASGVLGALFMSVCFIARVDIGAEAVHWGYPYDHKFSLSFLVPAVFAAMIMIASLWLVHRHLRRNEYLAIVFLFVVGCAVQLVMHAHAIAGLAETIVNQAANGFYTPTTQTSALEFLRNLQAARSISIHIASNMPGKVLFFYFLELFTESPTTMALIIIALSNLGGIFLYLAVRNLFNDRQVARYSLIVYLFIPGKIYFFPILNTVSPTPILCCFWLFTHFVKTPRAVLALALGLSLYLDVLFDPLTLSMGLLFAVFLVEALWRRKSLDWYAFCLLLLGTTAGFALTYASFEYLLGYDLLDSFLYARSFVWRFVSTRSYGVAVFENLFEFAVTAGVSLLATVPVVVFASRQLSQSWRDWTVRPIALWVTSILAVLAIIDVVGITRAESARIWLFLACFFAVIPAYVFALGRSMMPFAIFVCAMLLETAVGVGMVGFAMLGPA